MSKQSAPPPAEDTPRLEFSRRGHRRKPGYGLTYTCSNKDYTIYYGDICEGIDVRTLPHRWLAIYKRQTIIGRHAKRSHAEQSCQKHFNQQVKVAEEPKRRTRRK